MDQKALRELAVQTDTVLAKLYDKRSSLAFDVRSEVETREWYAKRLTERVNDWDARSYSERIAKADERITELRAKIAALNAEMDPLEAVYNEYRWTRAFLVLNSNGHVHKSMACKTCFPDTRFSWLPTYSGANEEQIVEDAGWRACTVCYPTAPVGVTTTRIFSDDEREQQKAREARAQAKTERDAKRAAKAPTKSGQPLVIVERSQRWDGKVTTYKRELKTEVTAVSEYVRMAMRYDWGMTEQEAAQRDPDEYASRKESMAAIEAALAEKHGVTVEEERARLAKKVADKRKRDR